VAAEEEALNQVHISYFALPINMYQTILQEEICEWLNLAQYTPGAFAPRILTKPANLDSFSIMNPIKERICKQN